MAIERVIGKLLRRGSKAVSSASDYVTFGKETIQLIQANWYLFCLGEKLLTERIKEQNLDLITGLPMRRDALEEFQTKYVDILQELVQEGGVAYMACLLIDADNFKIANDTYGHPFGDKVLAKIADVLKHQTREGEDLVLKSNEKSGPMFAKQGGDEFMAIGKVAHRDDGLVWANRICSKMGNTPIETPTGDDYRQTVSIGVYVAEINEKESQAYEKILESQSFTNRRAGKRVRLTKEGNCLLNILAMKKYELLYECADKALYDAKEKGRNRVETRK